MKHRNHPVTQEDIRPAGPLDRCFYCRAKLGDQHEASCVCRECTIMVDVTVSLMVRVPESWDTNMTEFHFNESSWCASNIADSIIKAIEHHADSDKDCLCNRCSISFVREATAQDEKDYEISA